MAQKDYRDWRLAGSRFLVLAASVRTLRAALRIAGIESGVKVVFSTERPRQPYFDPAGGELSLTPAGLPRRGTPASISFVPPAAGLALAGVVVNDLLRVGEMREQ